MKKYSRITATVMLIAFAGFVIFALNHPDMSSPWSNTISYILYGAYLFVMVILFIAPGGNKEERKDKVSYYVGWGTAWGTALGTMFGMILQEYLATMFFLGIACGACIGGIYGKKKLN